MIALRAYVGQFTQEYTDALAALVREYNFNTREGRQAATPETIEEFRNRSAELRELYGDITVSDLVDHVDHAVAVAGIDHVGIGSDFDGGGGVGGWNDASETYNVTIELLRRGYSREDIAKIWGGNLLRVMAAVEEAGVNRE